jgi:hypothetical protein
MNLCIIIILQIQIFCLLQGDIPQAGPKNGNKLTTYMEQSHYREAYSCSARLLWNSNVYYRVHKGQPLIPNLNLINPVHTILVHRSILIVSHLCLGLPNRVFPSGFPTRNMKMFFLFWINLHDHQICTFEHFVIVRLTDNFRPNVLQSQLKDVTQCIVLRRIFGPKRDKLTGGWRKLHNELNSLYF